MKRLKKALKTIIYFFLIIAIADIVWVHLPKVIASNKIDDVLKYQENIDDISIADNVKIVGLGEASHGNAEFQELKLSLLKSLIKNKKLKSFALEMDFGEGIMIDKYINGENLNIDDLVSSLSFNIYKTKEIQELIEWMRQYNNSAYENDKLSFYGFDIQNPEKSIEYVIEYCQNNNILTNYDIKNKLEVLKDSSVNSKDKRIEEAKIVLEKIKENLSKKNKDKYSKLIERAITCILDSIKYYEVDFSDYEKSSTIRDSYMAENIEWIYNNEKAKGNSQIMVSGHNGHIASKTQFYKNMGSILREKFGKDYFIIGTDYFNTTCNINNIGKDRRRGNYNFNSADPMAYQAKDFENGKYYLDFSKVDKDSQTYATISSKMSMGSLGEGYSFLMKVLPYTNRIKEIPIDLYDSMIFVYQANPIEIKSE